MDWWKEAVGCRQLAAAPLLPQQGNLCALTATAEKLPASQPPLPPPTLPTHTHTHTSTAHSAAHLHPRRGCAPPAAPPCAAGWPSGAGAPPPAQSCRGWPQPNAGAAGCRWRSCGRWRPAGQGRNQGRKWRFEALRRLAGCSRGVQEAGRQGGRAAWGRDSACLCGWWWWDRGQEGSSAATQRQQQQQEVAAEAAGAAAHLEAAVLEGGGGHQLAHGVHAHQPCGTGRQYQAAQVASGT